jgi:hypothetical protein
MNAFYPSQYKFIVKKFGQELADSANYGWVTDDDAYLTKVYTTPVTIVETTRDFYTKKLTHTAYFN